MGLPGRRHLPDARLPLPMPTKSAEGDCATDWLSPDQRVARGVAAHEVRVAGDTTVVDAYLSPILRRYVEQVQSSLGDVRLQFMQSSGGLTDAHRFAGQGRDPVRPGRRHRRRRPP